MTHDELLFKIYEIHNNNSDAGQEATKQYKGMIQFMQALRAVSELHKPSSPKQIGTGYAGDRDMCSQCKLYYPCPTIDEIEKELK